MGPDDLEDSRLKKLDGLEVKAARTEVLGLRLPNGVVLLEIETPRVLALANQGLLMRVR